MKSCQYLTGLKLTLEAIERLPPESATSRLTFAQNIVDTLLARVRDLSTELRPVALDNLGLLPALDMLFTRYTAQTRIAVNFEHEALRNRYPPDIETGIYRIIQEALTNVARHAHIESVSIHFWEIGGYLLLYVTDTGRGFDPKQIGYSSSGLAGMRERVLALNGEIVIDSQPGHGTQISVSIPIPSCEESPQNDHPPTVS
jgi:signal transduction histidine kinase